MVRADRGVAACIRGTVPLGDTAALARHRFVSPSPTYPVQLAMQPRDHGSRLSPGPAPGEYKLLDVNRGLVLRFRVSEDDAGVDVVRALHLDLTGREVRRRPQSEGRVFMVERSDLLASLGYHRAGDLSLRSWLSSLQGTGPVRQRRPGSVPPAQGHLARTSTSARPFEQRFDTKVHTGEATAMTTVMARSRPDSMHGSGPAHGR
jgi:hypothetical protein